MSNKIVDDEFELKQINISNSLFDDEDIEENENNQEEIKKETNEVELEKVEEPKEEQPKEIKEEKIENEEIKQIDAEIKKEVPIKIKTEMIKVNDENNHKSKNKKKNEKENKNIDSNEKSSVINDEITNSINDDMFKDLFDTMAEYTKIQGNLTDSRKELELLKLEHQKLNDDFNFLKKKYKEVSEEKTKLSVELKRTKENLVEKEKKVLMLKTLLQLVLKEYGSEEIARISRVNNDQLKNYLD